MKVISKPHKKQKKKARFIQKKQKWSNKYKKLIWKMKKKWLINKNNKSFIFGTIIVFAIFLLLWYVPTFFSNKNYSVNTQNTTDKSNGSPTSYTNSNHQKNIKQKNLGASYYNNIPSEETKSKTQYYSSGYSNNEPSGN